ncbi:MAG: hypothetical protein K6B67_07590 [Lachnospiraceae bacterium]|nr:hypothetical protein [Lachnospiraceae bacterium]
MSKLWNELEVLNIVKKKKNILFILGGVIKWAVIGALVGLIPIALGGLDVKWLVCFIGYPAFFIGFLCSVIYIYNNEFS